MEQSRAWVQALRENIGKVLVGKEETIDLVLDVYKRQFLYSVQKGKTGIQKSFGENLKICLNFSGKLGRIITG